MPEHQLATIIKISHKEEKYGIFQCICLSDGHWDRVFGLIALIIITYCMSFLYEVGNPAPAVPAPSPAPIQPELVAAISAAVAEDMGTDITGIRILSIKKL